MSGFGACALLGDAPALLPAPLGIECHCEHQQQKQQCNESTLEEEERRAQIGAIGLLFVGQTAFLSVLLSRGSTKVVVL